tara:strand:- start:356 stop:751 length:396 start_codon:yes stop_codon:yes gene_type:complete
MKTIARDLGVIIVAMAAGLLFASTVQAQGVGYGFGYHSHSGHGHQHRKIHRGHGIKWGHVKRHRRSVRVVYVTRPPVQVPVYIPVAAPAPVQVQSDTQCREYNATAVIDGRRVPVYGTACRQPDGSWRIVD